MKSREQRLSSRWIFLALLSLTLAACGGSGGSDDTTRIRNNGITNRVGAGEDAAEARRREARSADAQSRSFNNGAFSPTNSANSNTPGTQTPDGRSSRGASSFNLGGTQFSGTGGGDWQSMLFPLGLLGIQAAMSGIGGLFGAEPAEGQPRLRGTGNSDDGNNGSDGPEERPDRPDREGTPPANVSAGEQTGGRALPAETTDSSNTPAAVEAEETEEVAEGSEGSAEDVEDILAIDEEEEEEEPATETTELEVMEGVPSLEDSPTDSPDATAESAPGFALTPEQLAQLLSSDGVVWLDCDGANKAQSSEDKLNAAFDSAQSGS